jgi:hypothetical protein
VARNAEAGAGTVPNGDELEDEEGNGAAAEAVDAVGDASANGAAPAEG